MAPNKLRIAIATYSNVQVRLFLPVIKDRKLSPDTQFSGNVGRKVSFGELSHVFLLKSFDLFLFFTCHGILKGMELAGRDLTQEREVAWWRLFMIDTPRPAGVEGQPLLLPPKNHYFSAKLKRNLPA
uniref:Uncharacterized protein n=1 Tax=Salix viminalis TaxID=40686 RepID=A0A6N2NEU4_SALVM